MKNLLTFVLLSLTSFAHAQRKVSVKSTGTLEYQEGRDIQIEVVADTVVYNATTIAFTLIPKNAGANRAADLINISPLNDSIVIQAGDSIGRLTLRGKIDDNIEWSDSFLFRITSVPVGFTKSKPDSIWVVLIDSINPTLTGKPLYRINQIKGDNPNGIPFLVSQNCTIRGILYGINRSKKGYDMAICDGTGCINIIADRRYINYPTAKEGDSVEITGYIDVNLGLGLMRFSNFGDTIKLLGYRAAGGPRTVTKLDESTESNFVRMENLRLSYGLWAADSNYILYMKNPSNEVVEVYIYNEDNFISALDQIQYGYLYTIIGLGSQMDFTGVNNSGYQISPQKPEHINRLATTNIQKDEFSDLEFSLYPTLLLESSNFKIDFRSNRHQNLMLKVSDITGKIIYNAHLKAKSGLNQLDVNLKPTISSGSYFVHLESEDKTTTKRITVSLK